MAVFNTSVRIDGTDARSFTVPEVMSHLRRLCPAKFKKRLILVRSMLSEYQDFELLV